MSVLRKLASQTAIYGLSSIVARFLNYLLTPLHTSKSVFSESEYGVISEMYAYVAFLIIFLTYGMETAFFRFYSKEENDKRSVFTTTFWTLFVSSSLFIFVAVLFSGSIAGLLDYSNHPEYIVWFAVVVGLDALSSIPMAYLRAEGKAMRFAMVNIISVAVNILLNLFFLAYCMPIVKSGNANWLTDTFYNPAIGVGYVFIANLASSIVKFILLSPEIARSFSRFSFSLLEKMLLFGLPLMIAGFAGMINETIDRILLKKILSEPLGTDGALAQVGIYSAVYKLSIIITLFIQAFRYAAEPFFFAQEKEKNSGTIYARVMNYFVIVCAVIFLGVMLYIDVLKHFVPNQAYWNALHIVPVLLFANIFLGIYYNQSIWYKLSGRTMYGAWIAVFGAILTLVLNVILIPVFGFVGSAWTTFACYGSMMVLSYFLGRRFYPVPYKVGKVFFYLTMAFAMYYGSTFIPIGWGWERAIIHSFILGVYMAMIWFIERPLKNLNSHESQSH
ncbi:MAG TPA: oligosaccharide flippase family protein [Flavobacteriales bacterium]|nr:oligosaccharide flippase family protein [Flavobacteriales bacterium]HRE96855.1 oligosaccharide flippase family protein [Flavobacteriales bacterium]HRJ35506.1 oligosaccharide flippase family protein [Flavobacteriales bacterium]HRJ38523.1 oligosaccharide flippase family protein [Flavobacteriales bacterium]